MLTEDEWLTSTRFDRLGGWVIHVNPRRALFNGLAPRRKLRLLSCALVRSVVEFARAEETVTGLEFAERFAEGEATTEERDAVLTELKALDEHLTPVSSRSVNAAVTHALGDDPNDLPLVAFHARSATHAERDEELTQLAILRDVVFNPFRPVYFSPKWRTETAVLLARQMCDARDFSAMPILADALQDAGCNNANILDHCRQPGTHIRGCWVVDLVLGAG
jgi:hypothetical protein